MMKNFKKSVYLVALIGFNSALAGSYDDFFIAIKRDSASTVRALLARGFDPNTVDPNGVPGLILAVREPSPRTLEVLLASPQLKVEVRNPLDESPLMLAALQGDLALVRKLIALDADVNKPGWAPLHYAATHGHLDVMRLLLEHHAYIDAESPNGSTPLMMAAGYGTPEAVQLLLDAGADPLLKNQLGLTAIDFAHRAERAESVALITTEVQKIQQKTKQ